MKSTVISAAALLCSAYWFEEGALVELYLADHGY